MGQLYDIYQNYTNNIYDYSIISFDEIISVKVNVNSITTFQSSTVNKSILKRSVTGALLAGGAGAVIGGVTAQKNIQSSTMPNEVEIIIQTSNENHKIINFKFNKSYYYPNSVLSNQLLVDAMTSTFKNTDKLFKFKEQCH